VVYIELVVFMIHEIGMFGLFVNHTTKS